MIVVSRSSTLDATKRRQFEISIDTPIHILSCRATHASSTLPAYTRSVVLPMSSGPGDCGCVDASGATGSQNTSQDPTLETQDPSDIAPNSSNNEPPPYYH